MHKKEVRELLCAMLIGDGYLRISETPGHTVGSFWCEHSKAQYDYMVWKSELLNSFFKHINIDRECKLYTRDRFDKRTGKVYKSCSFCLNWKSYLSELHQKCYIASRKNNAYLLSQMTTDKHLAIWFMDDCSESKTKVKHKDGTVYYRNPYFRLAVQNLTHGEVVLTKDWFEKQYNVFPVLGKQKSGYILQFSVNDTKKLFPRIRPYVSQITSMRSKFSLCLERC
jgi:hypothetical protein